ncbi:hypothetical protein [Lysobacter sp. CA199]|uniref:hypothetical protein n=1 Tax=Lysobacter sp. CA199 TaxID=3455608 RepID=UPI003F8D1D40
MSRIDVGVPTRHFPQDIPAQPAAPVQAPAEQPAAPQPTPAQRTDQALKNYQAAITQRDKAVQDAEGMHEKAETLKTEQAKISEAKRELDAAIAAEIGPQVDQAQAGVPGQFRRPTGELVNSYGNVILQRHANEPAVQAVLKQSIGDYQAARRADELIPTFHGDITPKDKFDSLKAFLKGEPPEVVAKVMQDPRVQQWVKDAGAWVAEPLNGVDKGAGNFQAKAAESAQRLADTVEGLPPELATQIAKESFPTIEKIAAMPTVYRGDAITTPKGPFENMSRVVGALGDTPLNQSLRQDIAKAYLKSDDVKYEGFVGTVLKATSAGANPALAIELASQLKAEGRGDFADNILKVAADGALNHLNRPDGPKAQFDKAHQASVDKDTRLAELLAKSGPLTTEQQTAFIKAYRNDPENQKVYKAEAEAAKTLADELKVNKEALLFAAGRNPEAAQKLYDSMKALKDSGQGAVALEFTVAIQKDPSSAVAQAFNKFGDFNGDFTEQVIAAAAGQLLANHNGDPKGAFAELKEMIDPLLPLAKSIPGVLNLKDGIEAVKLASEGRFDRLAQLTANYEKLPPALRGLGAAGVVFGAASGSAGLKDGDYAKAVNGFAAAGHAGAKTLAAATKSLADAGKLAAYGDSALSFASFSSKLAPGLGIVASAASAVSNGGKLFGGDASYAVSFAGDVISVLGGALEYTVVLAPVGLIVQGIGALVGLVGGLIVGHAKEEAFKNEQNKYLEAAGISNDSTRKALIDSDPEQVKNLQALGLSNDQIQDLATNYPQLLESHHGHGPPVSNLKSMQQRLNLSGGELYQMLKAADANGPPGEGSAALLHVLTHTSWFPRVGNAPTRADLANALEQEVKDMHSDEMAKALNQAAQWLRTH